MSDARLEGFAREQLARGRGEWTIAHDLVRMGRLEVQSALALIRKCEASAETSRRSRGQLFLGLALILIPASLAVLTLASNQFRTLSDVIMAFAIPPISFPMIVGIAVLATWRRRGLSSSRPVRTGLWWRADPFECK